MTRRDHDPSSPRAPAPPDSRELYRRLVEGSIQGLLIVSEARKALFANQAAAKIFGYDSPEELMALESTAVLIAPSDFERHNAIREQFFQDPLLAPSNYVMEGRHKDGSVLHLEVRAGAIDWHGQLAAQITLFDVTERKRIEARLQQTERLEAIGRLTGGVAHDFNNLLSIIIGNAELCRDNLVGRERAHDLELVEEILRAGQRGRSLMQQLLAFARRQALQPRPVEIPDLLQSLAELLRRALGQSIDLRIEAGRDLWPVAADPGQLEVALINLAINGREAMRGGGILTIACRNRTRGPDPELPDRETVAISVRDDGTGMPADVAARAFEPFFTTKAFGQSSGLGLSMVYGFAKQSGGEVRLRSTPGRGTSVTIYLPRAREGLRRY